MGDQDIVHGIGPVGVFGLYCDQTEQMELFATNFLLPNVLKSLLCALTEEVGYENS
jgi:hypothetical protein